jgi:hypothetical protein
MRTNRLAAAVASALLACVLGSCEAQPPSARPEPPSATSPGQEPAQDAREPVADDLHRLADRFVRYAVGDARSFPHRESVSLAIGGEVVASIDDVAAALADRDVWERCPAGADMYGASSCPVDLLGPLRDAEVNDTPLVHASALGTVTCAPTRTGPLTDGRLVVIRPGQEHRTCAGDFALALLADAQGRLRSVDLTLSAP